MCNQCLKLQEEYLMNKEKRMAYCTNNTQVGFHTGTEQQII